MGSRDRAGQAGAEAGLARSRGPAALDQAFDRQGLVALRAAVAAHGTGVGVPPGRVDDLVVLAHELASNAVRHGGGQGRLRLWRADGFAHCEVSDDGPGLADPEGIGRQRAPLAASDGRGLWIVRQLADEVRVRTRPGGTVVTALLRLPNHASPPGQVSRQGR
ncbi:MAG TPA: ATP-binding protein [Micromonosporaceae bacterium]|nr:ATP-binding protein [Micromonosporaceae bacterium]